jgi:6-phosphogluconolactonase (cycloisomerase 2 family)
VSLHRADAVLARRERATRVRSALVGVGAVLAVALCGQSCGDTPANSVAALTPLTRVYAFEPGQIYAYQVDSEGHISGVGGVRFRIPERNWNRVISDRSGRFLFAIAESEGEIWAYALDSVTGMPSPVPGSPFRPKAPRALHAATVVPLSPHMYVAGEVPPGGEVRGDVTGFRIDPITGALTEIDDSPFPAGFQPYRVWSDPNGAFVYAANNGTDDPWRKRSLSVYRVDGARGTLTNVPRSPYETPAFLGHLQFHPSGRFLYATAEPFFLLYRIGADGALTALPRPSEPTGLPDGAYVRALSVTADGRFLHAVEDSGWIITYRIDADSGELSFVRETRGTQGFSGAIFHRSEPLAVLLGRTQVALQVLHIEADSGLPLPVEGPLFLAEGLRPYAGGAALFFDASGRILCVMVDDYRPSSRRGVRLVTYRLPAGGVLQDPVEESPVGEGTAPIMVVLHRGLSTQPDTDGAAQP